MKHPTHRILNAAYLYYYASDSIFRPSSGGSEAVAESSASVGIVEERKRRERLGARLVQLSGDLMVVAKNVSIGELERGKGSGRGKGKRGRGDEADAVSGWV
jgi:hypothetical protein